MHLFDNEEDRIAGSEVYTCIMHAEWECRLMCVCVHEAFIATSIPFQMHGSLQTREGVPCVGAPVHGTYSGKDLMGRTW